MLLIEDQRGKRAALFLAVGVVTFGLALVTEMPARAALTLTGAPAFWSDAAGSAWRGEVALRDRIRVGWDADLARSLALGALAADVVAAAPDTDLRGQVQMRPGAVALERVRGVGGWALVAAAAPDLPFACDVDLRVDVPWLAFGGDRPGAEGEVVSAAGPCSSTGAFGVAPPTLPTLIAQATRNDAATTITLAPRDNRAERLAEATLTRTGRLTTAVLPAGTALIAGAAAPTGASGGL